MAKPTSTRYYQLTENIMLEYVYSETDKQNMEGDKTEFVIDLNNKNRLYKVDNPDIKKLYLFCRDSDGDNKSGHNYDNLVVSVSNNDTKFVKMTNEYGMKYTYGGFNIVDMDHVNSYGEPQDGIDFSYWQRNGYGLNEQDLCDMVFDKCIIHFTGGNCFSDYESLIFQMFVRDMYDNKISFASVLFKRTDDVELDERPLMLNQKLYTTHISFRVPSANYLLSQVYRSSHGYNINQYTVQCIPNIGFTNLEGANLKLQKNTPIEFNVLGVRSTTEKNGFEFYNTVELNSIQFPNFDSYKKVNIEIEEATDGDYFNIYAQVNRGGNNVMSFSDYMYSIDAHPSEYIVMYEISLIENYTDIYNQPQHKKTHTEYYLINMSINEDDNEIDDVVRFRPVCVYSYRDVSFTIDVKLRIINTEDNTTIVKSACRDFTKNDGYTSKYGKRIQRIMTDEYPIKVNVYNKRNDEELDYVKISKSGGNTIGKTIENHQYFISSLVECTNIGVSIQQISKTDVE